MQINWCCLRTFKARPEPRSRSLCSWGRVRRGRGRMRPSSGSGSELLLLIVKMILGPARLTPSLATRSTGRWLLQMLCSYRGRNNPTECCSAADHHDILTHCRPADTSHHQRRQTLSCPQTTAGWARGVASQGKCFRKNYIQLKFLSARFFTS